jgi:photosystem II stability/assembly factor-like uncharacterized protein
MVLKTTDDGLTWMPRPAGVTAALRRIRFPANAAVGWAVGDGGTVVRTTDGGETWVAQRTPGTLYDFGAVSFPRGDNEVGYLSIPGTAVLLRTTDGGIGFAEPAAGRPRPRSGRVSVTPSPATSRAVVSFELARGGNTQVRVFEATGRLVRVVACGRREAGRHRVPLQLGGLAGGAYFMRVDCGAVGFSDAGRFIVE